MSQKKIWIMNYPPKLRCGGRSGLWILRLRSGQVVGSWMTLNSEL